MASIEMHVLLLISGKLIFRKVKLNLSVIENVLMLTVTAGSLKNKTDRVKTNVGKMKMTIRPQSLLFVVCKHFN